jgi:hypothetical protein
MSKINEININITKALITKISIELEGDTPKYTVSGKLLTEQGMAVSDFIFMSEKSYWSEDKVIEVPMGIHFHSAEIFKALTPVIYKKINGLFKELPAPKQGEEELPF